MILVPVVIGVILILCGVIAFLPSQPIRKHSDRKHLLPFQRHG